MGTGALAAAGSLLIATLALKLWKADFAVPWSYSKDGLFNLMIVKSTIDHGWYLHNPSLGFPFGQDLHDFPVVEGDTLHLLIIKLIAVFTSNPAVVANVFFLITFPLTAAIAYWALRRLRITPAVACACATLYALAPYHFLRGELHLFLQGYFAVPAGIWLALAVALGEPLFERRLRSRATLTTLAVCLLVATSEVYYAAFTVMLIAAAALLVLLRGRRAAALSAVVAIAAISFVLVVEHLPTLLYHAEHGANAEVARLRSPYDSEIFGLRPIRLMLPVEHHRLSPLAKLTQRYEDNSSDQLGEGATQAIGLVALAGLVWLIVRVLSGALAGIGREPRPPPGRTAAAGVLSLTAILIATTSGLGMVLAVYVTDSVRSWARMSIILAFLGILGAALTLDRLLPRLTAARGGRAGVAVLLVIVVLGALDQTTPSMVPDYKAIAADWNADKALDEAIEARLPSGSPVFQLPFVPVPEYGFDQARGFLHSNSLRWSWGAIAGRPADWQTPLVGKPPEVLMATAAVTGFKGLYLNLGLYPDGRPVLRDFTKLLGAQPLISSDGRLAFLDLRPFAARLGPKHSPGELAALRDSALNPARIVFGPDWGALIISPSVPESLQRARWSHKPTSTLTLENPGGKPREVSFSAALFAGSAADASVRWPDGFTQELKVSPDGTQIRHSFVLAPGKSGIVFSTNAEKSTDPTSAKPSYLELENFTLTDSVQQSFAKSAAG